MQLDDKMEMKDLVEETCLLGRSTGCAIRSPIFVPRRFTMHPAAHGSGFSLPTKNVDVVKIE